MKTKGPNPNEFLSMNSTAIQTAPAATEHEANEDFNYKCTIPQQEAEQWMNELNANKQKEVRDFTTIAFQQASGLNR